MSRRARGFTLMEMLVTLMLVAFATMLMFQTLGSYRIARERVQAQSGDLDRQALLQDWMRASVQGLFIDNGLTFAGDGESFSGTTLNPLHAPEGAPTPLQWSIESADGRVEVVYTEDGRERWRLPLAHTTAARFEYLDRDGRAHGAWPPKLGKDEDILPPVVVLVREGAGGKRAVAMAVLGPLKPVIRLFGEEDA